MNPKDYLVAWVMQKTGPATVSYGNELQFAGQDLPAPTSHRIPTRHGKVKVEVYRPRRDTGTAPVLLHLHGGAFIMRYPRMDDFWCRYMASQTSAAVVNVDYDVAPQAAYPVAQHQAHDVAEWISSHGDDLGLDGSRIAIGGLSAGGNLAASACLQARDRGTFTPLLQILGVPSLELASDPGQKQGLLGSSMISPGLMRLVRRTYFKDPSRRSEPYASPLLASDLSGLPPAIVMTGELDVLRAEGDDYAKRLSEAGVEVIHDISPRADHYFLSANLTRARQTMAMVAAEVERRLAD